jgi:hypothetical protein
MGTNATPHTIGQWHIEFQIRAIDNNGWMVGFADSTVGLTSYCGTASAGFSVQAQNTVSALQGYYGGTTATLNSGVTIAVNDRIALEIWGGSANQSIWVQNFTHKAGVWTDDTGGWTGNPQTNTGGFLGSMSSSTGILPCFSGAFSGAGNAAIMYTKASQFAVAISSGGFVAWDPP